MHARPAHAWTIEELAHDVGASRSVLAERFAELVGLPPMHYLANWRMQIASGLLSNGVNIATVAAETGYGSEAAFSRAFKKLVGVPPSAWRRRGSPASGAGIEFKSMSTVTCGRHSCSLDRAHPGVPRGHASPVEEGSTRREVDKTGS